MSYSFAKRIRQPIRTSRVERDAGISLFLVVTVCWMFGFASAEQDWIRYEGSFVLIAAALSAVSVVVTGYVVGRYAAALWLGWVPGATIMAIGFAMTPTPGADETGGGLIFVGGLVLFGWALYFFPLIALGVWLRHLNQTRS